VVAPDDVAAPEEDPATLLEDDEVEVFGFFLPLLRSVFFGFSFSSFPALLCPE
jgi:hypothetical protein